MNYYERHIGDYLKDTAHLSMIEHGAYSRLLDVYYTREGPIEDGEAIRLVSARTPAERAAVRAVLLEFFEPDGEPPLWRHKRCDAEIARYQDKRGKAKASADARWSQSERNANASASSMRTHSERNANGMPRAGADARTPQTHTPDTIPREEITKLPLGRVRPSDAPPQLSLVTVPEKAKGPPDCPHLEILALWSQQLPALPEHVASQWKGARADHLRARWRETAVEERWPTQEPGLTYFRRLFAYIGRSKFLTGNAPSQPGRAPFVITLAWLVKPENWAKTIEGNYHPEQQA